MNYSSFTQDTQYKAPQPLQLEIIIKWVYEIAEANSLETKTIELTAEYIKLYLSVYQIHTEFLQLLAVASLLIAIKFNECQSRVSLSIDECITLGQSQYSADQIVGMELCILKLLNFQANKKTLSDYFEEQDQVKDLILFVTLDSHFHKDDKETLAKAIRHYLTKEPISKVLEFAVNKLRNRLLNLATFKPIETRKKIRKYRRIRKSSSSTFHS